MITKMKKLARPSAAHPIEGQKRVRSEQAEVVADLAIVHGIGGQDGVAWRSCPLAGGAQHRITDGADCDGHSVDHGQAAADADVLPVEAQITARAPFSTAFEIASVMPLSLNDPVGFAPSNFKYRSIPGAIFLASLAA